MRFHDRTERSEETEATSPRSQPGEQRAALDREDRYSRQRLVDGWRQDRLEAARLLVVGAGAIGNEALAALAMMGVGGIDIVDMDAIECSNLARTVLFRPDDVGRNKALAAAEALLRIQPSVCTRAFTAPFQHAIGAGALAEYDLVLGCVDNVEARLAVNRLCLRAGVPWIDAAIDTHSAEVRIVPGGEQGCYECSLPLGARKRLRKRVSCADNLLRALSERRVPTLATVAGLAGRMLVHEAVRWLHSFGEPQACSIRLDTRGWRTSVARAPRSTSCTAHAPIVPDATLEVGTCDPLGAVVAASEQALGVRPKRIGFDHAVVLSARCRRCGEEEPVAKPQSMAEPSVLECRCGGERELEVAHSIPADDPRLAAFELRHLGVPEKAWLRVLHGPFADDELWVAIR